VCADPAALDRWRQASLGKAHWWSGPWLLRLWAITATAILAIAGVAYLVSTRRGLPARFRHEFNSLVVSDENGREIWRTTFQETFHSSATPEDLLANHSAWFGDLDGDSRIELLYTYRPASVNSEGGTLFCFSQEGREKWRFVPGKVVSSRQATFPRCYTGTDFVLLPPGRDRTRRTVFAARHNPRYPSQVVVLSHSGTVLGEYWHSGHLGPLHLADLVGDSRPEVIVTAISNGYKAASLLVLDPNDLGGAAEEENQDYQLLGFGPGREKARILFPRTCINRKLHEYGVPGRLTVRGDVIEVVVSEGAITPGGQEALVFYRLNRKLEVTDVAVNDLFRVSHHQLEAAGQLDHPLTEKEISELRKLRYLKRLGG
jgi:hypothetical protein